MRAADVVGAREIEFDVVAELVRDHVLVEFVRVFGEVREQHDVLGHRRSEEGSVGLAAPVDDERGEVGVGRDAEDGLHALVDRVEHRERSGGACAGRDAGGTDAGGNVDVVRGAGARVETAGLGVGIGRVPPATPSCTRTSHCGLPVRCICAITRMVMLVLLATDQRVVAGVVGGGGGEHGRRAGGERLHHHSARRLLHGRCVVESVW